MNMRMIASSGRGAAINCPARPGLAARLAIAAISGYQRHISPRKGFRCAHRKLHGQESCSQYIKGLVEMEGLSRALYGAPARFRACAAASRILRAEMIAPDGDSPDPATGKKPKRVWGSGARGDDDGLCGVACCLAELFTDASCCG